MQRVGEISLGRLLEWSCHQAGATFEGLLRWPDTVRVGSLSRGKTDIITVQSVFLCGCSPTEWALGAAVCAGGLWLLGRGDGRRLARVQHQIAGDELERERQRLHGCFVDLSERLADLDRVVPPEDMEGAPKELWLANMAEDILLLGQCAMRYPLCDDALQRRIQNHRLADADLWERKEASCEVPCTTMAHAIDQFRDRYEIGSNASAWWLTHPAAGESISVLQRADEINTLRSLLNV